MLKIRINSFDSPNSLEQLYVKYSWINMLFGLIGSFLLMLQIILVPYSNGAGNFQHA